MTTQHRFTLTMILAAGVSVPSLGAELGMWAASGTLLGSQQEASVPAPNGLLSIGQVQDEVPVFVSGGTSTRLKEILSPPFLTEVLWSPKSDAFVLNSSDGGLVGTWDGYVYFVGKGSRLSRRTLRSLIRPLLRGWPQCPEVPNVGASGWLSEAHKLLVVAEVPPHSSCRNMGAILGFKVDVVSWKVEQRIPENDLRSSFRAILGPRFLR